MRTTHKSDDNTAHNTGNQTTHDWHTGSMSNAQTQWQCNQKHYDGGGNVFRIKFHWRKTMEKTNSLPLYPPKTLENQLITYGKIP
jgi:hypothetical protein